MVITDTHVYFYTARPFHNWVRTPNQLVFRGLTCESTENAFMIAKAWFFSDLDMVAAIHAEQDPRAAKELGRQIKGYDDAAWSTVREGWMAYVNLLKYRGNPEWARQLLDTGSRIIVEASPIDTVWGCGLSEKDPMILDSRFWRGQNLLGEALMTVRGLLVKERASST